MTYLTSFLLLIMLGNACPAALAQDKSPISPAAVEVAERVGANDLLALRVSHSPELTQSFRVTADGDLHLPLLKGPISVAGMLPSEIEATIRAALMEQKLFINPVVSVSVAEYRSRSVTVVGAVRRPTTFQAVGDMRLLDALARAEGLGTDAGPEILVTPSRTEMNPEPLPLRIPVRALIDAADPSLNLRLYGGEEIRVPEAGKVYVAGNVKRPGVFLAQDQQGLTVLKLLALSEGLLPYSSKKAYVYRREGEAGDANRVRELEIELGRIIDRKAPDVALRPGDVLYVPDAKGRRLAGKVLDRILTFAATTASGALIYGGRR